MEITALNESLLRVELFNSWRGVHLIEMSWVGILVIVIATFSGLGSVSGIAQAHRRQTHELRAQCQGNPRPIKPCWETFLSNGKTVYNFYFEDVEAAGEEAMTGWLGVTISSSTQMDPPHRLLTGLYVSPTRLTVYIAADELPLALDSTTSFVTLCDTGDACIPCLGSSVWSPDEVKCVCPVDKIVLRYETVTAKAQLYPDDVIQADMVECSPCPSFQKGVDGVCVCMDGFQALVDTFGRFICQCSAGFEPLFNASIASVTCVKCGDGSYKAEDGNIKCASCPPGEHRSVDGTTCTCPVDRVVERGIELQCVVCKPGTFEAVSINGVRNGTCINCPLNHISQYDSATVCTPCTNGTFSNPDRTACQCSGNQALAADGSDCVCKPQHFRTDAAICELCPVDMFKAVLGDENCTQCPIGSTNWPVGTRTGWICQLGQFSSGDTCMHCPRDSMSWPVDVRTSCVCEIGMFLSGDACIPCSRGTYKGEQGYQACDECDIGKTTVSNGSTFVEMCVCAAGYFINDSLDCEACPVNTHNPLNLAIGLESCRPCQFRVFQPSIGGAECVPQNVGFAHLVEYDSNVVGLFVSETMSCAYINRIGGSGGDQVCWGGGVATNLTVGVFDGIPSACGDGVLLPLVEECDDGNMFGGDGCSPHCSVEPHFFCPSAEVIMDVSESLWVPSTCCRLGGVLSQTSMCTRCQDRELPFPGMRYRESDCKLEDIDECVEGIDGCVLQTGGVSCVNLDALVSDGGLRFECVCAPGLFVSDQGCVAERFRTQFVLEVNHTEYPDAVVLVTKFTKQLLDGVAPEMLVEEEGRSENVGPIRVTLPADSWASMQNSVGKLDTTRLVELMQAVPRDAYGIQARFSVVDVARYGFNGNILDSSGNGYTLQLIRSHTLPWMSNRYHVDEGSHFVYLQGTVDIRYGAYYRRDFPLGTFSRQLIVSIWAMPFQNLFNGDKEIFFSFETTLMDGYIYLYHYRGGLYLRARANGHAECAASRPYPFFPPAWASKTWLLQPSSFIEMTSELEDTDAAIAGATEGLSTINVNVGGIPALYVTGCMLDSTLYTKLHIGAASGVIYGLKRDRLKLDDLWIRNKVPIGQM
jgi:cysteine-rich repeat protein